MLLALPCGRDPLDVHAQTRALKTGFITYLQVKQAAGIINIVNSATKQVCLFLHFGARVDHLVSIYSNANITISQNYQWITLHLLLFGGSFNWTYDHGGGVLP